MAIVASEAGGEAVAGVSSMGKCGLAAFSGGWELQGGVMNSPLASCQSAIVAAREHLGKVTMLDCKQRKLSELVGVVKTSGITAEPSPGSTDAKTMWRFQDT